MPSLFEFFILSLVLLATGAAFFLLFDWGLDTEAAEPKATRPRSFLIGRAVHSKPARLAASTIIATIFGILEFVSHRIVTSIPIAPEMHAFWDGVIVAIGGAVMAWLLLSGREDLPVDVPRSRSALRPPTYIPHSDKMVQGVRNPRSSAHLDGPIPPA